MEQISMFEDEVNFPLTHDDVMSLYKKYIYEGETDDDVFTFSDIKKGKSYSFYGTKVFEHKPGTLKTARLCPAVIDDKGRKKFPPKKASDFTGDMLLKLLQELKQQKKDIFQNLIIEEFACCNDFIACSDAGHCLNVEDRFFNGCFYRKNLEAGKIFFGKNRNIESEAKNEITCL